ncbi:hypothetical protein CEXT_785061 [Caerostris extrusa]|uniref:Uncharacterized protein n=1 Tax=Caerostris extrusa TaxID=172846 RepID=A0AAV4W857_CAEEX|nr:hypothetical protein CEXT_785061 [Caerostris extrusa]
MMKEKLVKKTPSTTEIYIPRDICKSCLIKVTDGNFLKTLKGRGIEGPIRNHKKQVEKDFRKKDGAAMMQCSQNNLWQCRCKQADAGHEIQPVWHCDKIRPWSLKSPWSR